MVKKVWAVDPDGHRLLTLTRCDMAHKTPANTHAHLTPSSKAHGYKERRAEQQRQQVGEARVLGARFKKYNYPHSLVKLSKHPFFFTAPHKEPFDIFLMESAK